jgi:hypothetical protein
MQTIPSSRISMVGNASILPTKSVSLPLSAYAASFPISLYIVSRSSIFDLQAISESAMPIYNNNNKTLVS